jgi:uncharacterized protein
VLSDPVSTASTVAILVAATLVHSTVGFGTASVAMPLLALTLGVRTAAPLVAFFVVTTTTVIGWKSWRSIDLRATLHLLVASALGIPVGLLLLRTAPERWLKGTLGALLITYSVYSLVKPPLVMREGRAWAWVFGFLGGVLGGAFNTNAPPIVLYGALRRWSPERFRATLQGYFLPVGVMVWLGHGLTGFWTARVVLLYVLALPFVLLAIPVGGRFNRHIPATRFARILHVILIVFGILLLL